MNPRGWNFTHKFRRILRDFNVFLSTSALQWSPNKGDQNLANLQDRVGAAVDNLLKLEEIRRTQNKSLSRVLADLETKFEARTSELEECRKRISVLEYSNRSLSGLVGQLLDIVEKTATDIAEDPVYRAGNEARSVIDRFVGDVPANDRHETADQPAETLDTANGRFEDVDEDDLLAEELYEKNESATDYPKLVFDAVARASGETVAAQPASDSAPEPQEDQARDTDGDLDIKEIMARLEIAAERAQLRADEDARRDRIEPEDLDRAVGDAPDRRSNRVAPNRQ